MIHYYLLSIFSLLNPLLSGSVFQHSTKFALIKASTILLAAKSKTSCCSFSLCNLILSIYDHLHIYASQILSVPWGPNPVAFQTPPFEFSQEPQTHWFQPQTILTHSLFWITPSLSHSYPSLTRNNLDLSHIYYSWSGLKSSAFPLTPPLFLPLLWFRPSPSLNLMTTRTTVACKSGCSSRPQSCTTSNLFSNCCCWFSVQQIFSEHHYVLPGTLSGTGTIRENKLPSLLLTSLQFSEWDIQLML